jgi:hypothetical protein
MNRAAFSPSTRVIKITLFILLSFLTVSPAAASPSCACCAESGDWYERVAKVQDYESAELGRLRFNGAANLYTAAGDMEDYTKGLSVNYTSFNLSSLINPRRSITLRFKGEKGETGALVLALPKVMTSFGADMHDMPEGSAGPILYKELRFDGAASGSGFFKKGMAPGTRFRLILQGRGNNCLSAEDFKNWILQVTGPRASYAFYGALAEPQ